MITIKVRSDLLASLKTMYATATRGEPGTLSSFVSELVEANIASFRQTEEGRQALRLPRPPEPRGPRRRKKE